jgi:hypothetical protein
MLAEWKKLLVDTQNNALIIDLLEEQDLEDH